MGGAPSPQCGELNQEGRSTILESAIELDNPPQLWKTHAAVGDLLRHVVDRTTLDVTNAA